MLLGLLTLLDHYYSRKLFDLFTVEIYSQLIIFSVQNETRLTYSQNCYLSGKGRVLLYHSKDRYCWTNIRTAFDTRTELINTLWIAINPHKSNQFLVLHGGLNTTVDCDQRLRCKVEHKQIIIRVFFTLQE
ncbi:hypothetical protein L1987_77902 [Smallanthus sonchifolius]|uniref:Uncharacterized protein n=1 Tax=Smallanthus sonchifolius TaxID=185202 RepID=A0ACB8ZBD8_9ASTR|nr:hypothetical protein L1987_77902 [Smallanthus sonchifolius]